jgi:dihydrofolate reductase
MGSLILKMSISLDGYVAPPDGSTEWAGFWPSAPGPFAEPTNEIPKVVFSNSLKSADWAETTIASGDLTETVTRLKHERTGGYLLAQGGARFARSLVEAGLIDE